MELPLLILGRAHRSGFSTLEVLGRRGLVAFTADPADAAADLQLLVGEEIERTHPAHQAAFVLAGEPRLESVEVPEILQLVGAQRVERAKLVLPVVVSEQRGWRQLYVPRIPFHAWAERSEDWRPILIGLLKSHLERLPPSQVLALRPEKRDWLETLRISAEPPPLSAFHGKLRHTRLLPLQVERAEAEREAAEREAQAKRGTKPVPTPTLERIAQPLTRFAERGELPKAHGRQAELQRLLDLLALPGGQAIVLIGPPVVGKTALLHALVHRLRAADLPPPLRDRAVWFADAGRLVAVERFFGDWQSQTLDAIREVEASRAIWLGGDPSALLDAGKHIASEHNVAAVLKPWLAARRITLIAEASSAAWQRLQLRDPGFARLFTPFALGEPAADEARSILSAIGGPSTTPEALATVSRLAQRFAGEASAFGTGAHFLKRAAERAATQGLPKLERREVIRQFCHETGFPEVLLADELPLVAEEVEGRLRLRIIGQDDAVRRMVDLALLIKTGLTDLTQPLGSYLFVGPTGVGKTETAKALAAFLFGSETRLIRFDMSEFAGWDAVARFLGDARSEGKLVQAVRQRPFSVVLLDEIEKANPAIFDLLLQVLGEGRLTDESGRTAHFANTAVIMTSNLGVESWKEGIGFGAAATHQAWTAHFRREAERFFRPELLNRIDHVVAFLPLGAEQIRAIADRELTLLGRREGLRQRGLELLVEPTVADWIAARGVDVRYGARPLKRAIERHLAAPLARWLCRHRGEERRIRVTAGAQALVFSGDTTKGSPSVAGEAPLGASSPVADQAAAVADLSAAGRAIRGSRLHRDVATELRLLDQLVRGKRFFEDRERAARRLAGSAEKRAIVERLAGAEARAEQLAELLHEAWWERDGAAPGVVAAELPPMRAELREILLELIGTRHATPERGAIYLWPMIDGALAASRLGTIYLAIAAERGWKVNIHLARYNPRAAPRPAPAAEPLSPDDARKARAAARAAKAAAKTEKAVVPAVEWRRFTPRKIENPSDPADPELTRALENELADDATTLAYLAFEGRHAAAWLAHEQGLHLWKNGQVQSTVRVFAGESATRRHPQDLPTGLVPARLVDLNRNEVHDLRLDRHLALEPRLHRPYLRLIEGRLDEAALGSAGSAALARAEV